MRNPHQMIPDARCIRNHNARRHRKEIVPSEAEVPQAAHDDLNTAFQTCRTYPLYIRVYKGLVSILRYVLITCAYTVPCSRVDGPPTMR